VRRAVERREPLNRPRQLLGIDLVAQAARPQAGARSRSGPSLYGEGGQLGQQRLCLGQRVGNGGIGLGTETTARQQTPDLADDVFEETL
jgi:hypothetical protein